MIESTFAVLQLAIRIFHFFAGFTAKPNTCGNHKSTTIIMETINRVSTYVWRPPHKYRSVVVMRACVEEWSIENNPINVR